MMTTITQESSMELSVTETAKRLGLDRAQVCRLCNIYQQRITATSRMISNRLEIRCKIVGNQYVIEESALEEYQRAKEARPARGWKAGRSRKVKEEQ